MTAGRELDALVAEKVMGWKRWTCADFQFQKAVLYHSNPQYLVTWRRDDSLPLCEDQPSVPRYSTDIAAAWTVVEKMHEEGFGVEIGHACTPGYGWYATFVANAAQYEHSEDYEPATERMAVRAPATPLAICLAALKALDAEVPA